MDNKLYENVGKKGMVEVGGLKVEVKIMGYKQAYGRDRFLVTPTKGEGEVWIEKVIINK